MRTVGLPPRLRGAPGVVDRARGADVRRATQSYIDGYALREARNVGGMTQVELAKAMGVSQNRITRMEHGDLATMSLDTIRRHIEALGGKLSLIADLPTGKLTLL